MDRRSALRGLAGFAAGVVVWVLLTPVYDRVLATAAQAVLHAFEKPNVTRLRPGRDHYTTVDRLDFDPRSKRPAIPIRDLTFNFVLLAALFAASERPLSDRNVTAFLAASALLFPTHVAAVVAEVMSIYVAKLGRWSDVHHTALERNVWGVASHFYRLVLMYAIAFAIWWAFRARLLPFVTVAKGKEIRRRRRRAAK